MANILIIDDDQMLCAMLSRHFNYLKHKTVSAFNIQQGLEALSVNEFDVALLDVNLPDGNGLDAIPEIHAAPSAPEVIIITGEGDPDGAELAINNGAWDYIEKPSSTDKMTLPVVRALQYRSEKAAVKTPVALKRDEIIGNSPPMKACFDLLARAAAAEINVLITGATGTGKELFAKAVHLNSKRASKKFVVVDCAAMPETLVESTLFGHTKGAFTGADRTQEGLIKQADKGTLFLDEVGELPLSIQKKFLRVLQEHRFRPLGEKREIKSDFRLVSATNRNLDEMVQAGRFRADLLFRLKTIVIKLPLLKERPEDIKDITLNYLTRICDHREIGIKGFDPEFFDTLTAYDWPGNVRELLNALETALAAAHNQPTLFAKYLPVAIRVHKIRSIIEESSSDQIQKKSDDARTTQLPCWRDFRLTAAIETEKRYLHSLIALTQDNIKEACRVSKLSRSRLYELMKKHKIAQ
ncbi:sigma-54 dependent transcriptional regulator [Desulfococcaceae bacterium HSG9]|nr:sigma-54 dependent transcriptional regulator [Desulfococcaceae bacterium HSG9]